MSPSSVIYLITSDYHPDDGSSKHVFSLANFYQPTRRNNPDDSHLHIRRCEPELSQS
jgi:hypothetical protein